MKQRKIEVARTLKIIEKKSTYLCSNHKHEWLACSSVSVELPRLDKTINPNCVPFIRHIKHKDMEGWSVKE